VSHKTPRKLKKMTEETNDENNHDDDFAAYLEKAIPTCAGLTELIQAEIKKALAARSAAPGQSPEGVLPLANVQGGNTGTYLERQNAMLLAQLMNAKGGSGPILPPSVEPPEDDLPEEPLPTPKPRAKVRATSVLPMARARAAAVLPPVTRAKTGPYWR
jgi:hypothetical protein